MLVTTLRVVWIEISRFIEVENRFMVTTLRVVWIEMFVRKLETKDKYGHHLAGGVD